MKILPLRWTPSQGWSSPDAPLLHSPDLVLYFGTRELLLSTPGPLSELATRFPHALRAGCSTAGEILGGSVIDGGLVALAVSFVHTRVRAACVAVAAPAASLDAASSLARQLAAPDLRHILVLSDGLLVNGTQLTAGFRSSLPAGVAVSGGLAGDGPHFHSTVVGLGDDLASGRVVGIGFYGEHVRFQHGSASGWEPFGPRRLVTHALGNVLYSLDDQPALPLYKRYLGERAAGLPSTGLLFPLQLLPCRDAASGLVRTILAVDEAEDSLTFAGDIPQGSYVRLMRAGCDALVAGAEQAAAAIEATPAADRFAVLVSCVGRRLVMGQRTEEEVDAVLARLGGSTVPTIGFYSYGEISPAGEAHGCDLHNQTMTLTFITEDR